MSGAQVFAYLCADESLGALFQQNLRYDKMAEGLGARGEYVHTPEDFRAALKRSYDIAAKENVPTLIAVQGLREFRDGGAYPPGVPGLVEPGVGARYK